VRAVLIEGACLKAAIIGVGHFESGEAPLTPKVIANSLHEVKFRFFVLGPIVVRLRALLELLIEFAFGSGLILVVGQLHTAGRVQLDLEDVDGAVVAAAGEALALHVEANRVDFRTLRAAPDLLQGLPCLGRVHANDSAFVTRGCKQSAFVVEANGRQRAVVRWYLERLVLLVHVDSYVALLRVRRR